MYSGFGGSYAREAGDGIELRRIHGLLFYNGGQNKSLYSQVACKDNKELRKRLMMMRKRLRKKKKKKRLRRLGSQCGVLHMVELGMTMTMTMTLGIDQRRMRVEEWG